MGGFLVCVRSSRIAFCLASGHALRELRQHPVADDPSLDLARALEDRGQARVAPVALYPPLGGVAVAAVAAASPGWSPRTAISVASSFTMRRLRSRHPGLGREDGPPAARRRAPARPRPPCRPGQSAVPGSRRSDGRTAHAPADRPTQSSTAARATPTARAAVCTRAMLSPRCTAAKPPSRHLRPRRRRGRSAGRPRGRERRRTRDRQVRKPW